MFFEDIKQMPLQTIQELYRFLGADPRFVPPSLHVHINATKFKRTRIGRILHTGVFPLIKASQLGMRLHQNPALRRLFYRLSRSIGKKTATPPIAEQTKKRLQEFYRDDIEELENMIGRDLTHWKT